MMGRFYYRCLGLLLFACLQFQACAQSSDSIPWSPNVLYMHTWPDSNATFPYAFRMKMRLYYHHFNDFEGRHHFQKADVVWLTHESWLNDSVQEQYLPLSQLYFDVAEWKARLLQEVVNTTDSIPDLIRYRSELSLAKLIDQIGEETQNGADKMAMKKWELWADSALVAVPHRNYPESDPGKFTIGIQFFSGFKSFTTPLNQYLGTAVTNGIGFDLQYQRLLFGFYGSQGVFLKKGSLVISDYAFYESTSLSLRNYDLSVGYAAYRTDRFQLAPCAGGTIFRLLNKDEVKGSFFYKSRASSGWSLGVRGTFHFRELIQTMQARTGIRLWWYTGYSHMNFMEVDSGSSWSVLAGVGLHIKSVVTTRRNPWNYYF